jgi:hypothetical protein
MPGALPLPSLRRSYCVFLTASCRIPLVTKSNMVQHLAPSTKSTSIWRAAR